MIRVVAKDPKTVNMICVFIGVTTRSHYGGTLDVLHYQTGLLSHVTFRRAQTGDEPFEVILGNDLREIR